MIFNFLSTLDDLPLLRCWDECQAWAWTSTLHSQSRYFFFPEVNALAWDGCPWWLGKRGSEIKCAFVMCPVKQREVRGNSQKQLVSSALIIIGCLQDKLSLSLIYFIIILISNLPNFFFHFFLYARLQDDCAGCQSTCYLRHLSL